MRAQTLEMFVEEASGSEAALRRHSFAAKPREANESWPREALRVAFQQCMSPEPLKNPMLNCWTLRCVHPRVADAFGLSSLRGAGQSGSPARGSQLHSPLPRSHGRSYLRALYFMSGTVSHLFPFYEADACVLPTSWFCRTWDPLD